MATFEITSPDGGTYRVNAPDGATEQDAIAYVQKNHFKEQAPKIDATEGMSAGQKTLAGVGMGLSNVATGAKQRLDEAAAGLESLIPGGESISRFFGGKTAAQIKDQGQQAIREKKALDSDLSATGWGTAGNMLGMAAGGALAGPLGPVGSSVALGYATPTTEGSKEVLQNMAVSGALGYGGDKAIKGLSRVVQPKVNPQVQTLMNEGVTPTPGQIMGGAFAKAEDKATSIPILGDMIAGSQRRAATELNRAAFNRALEPIGQKLPMNVPAGREAVQFTDDALGAAYNKLLPKLTVRADDQFAQQVASLRTMVQEGALDPKYANQFDKVLTTRILDRFQGQNAMTGETLKNAESTLGNEIRRFSTSQDPDAQLLGNALKELQSGLRGLVQRSNPDHAKELQAINQGWANFKRVQRAASMVGAEDGVFSAAQLQNAVKVMDKSKDKGRFAEGRALMQDLSDPGKNVLGAKVPDSGTPGRLMNLAALGSGVYEPLVPMGLLAGSGMYTAPAQKVIAQLLTQRPEMAGLLSQQIRGAAPIGGLLGASAGLQ